jgi:hypothetical protein
MRVKYRAAVTRVARIKKRGRSRSVSTTCSFAGARWCSPFDGHVEGEHRTYVRTETLAAGRSLARSLDQGRSYLPCTYVWGAWASYPLPWLQGVHEIQPTWPLTDFLFLRADRKKKKEIVIVRRYAVGSNRLVFRKCSSADGLQIIGEIVKYHLSVIILDISSICFSDCDFLVSWLAQKMSSSVKKQFCKISMTYDVC